MFSMAKSQHDSSTARAEPETTSNRRQLALVVVVMALAMFAAFVYLLNEVVAGGERTRESWRATEVEKVTARATARDQRAAPRR